MLGVVTPFGKKSVYSKLWHNGGRVPVGAFAHGAGVALSTPMLSAGGAAAAAGAVVWSTTPLMSSTIPAKPARPRDRYGRNLM